MTKYFKDHSEKELKEIFNKDGSIRTDIKAMMNIGDNTTEDALEYFINECRNGAYSYSYYTTKGELRYKGY